MQQIIPISQVTVICYATGHGAAHFSPAQCIAQLQALSYTDCKQKCPVLENTLNTRLHTPTEKRGFVTSKFLALVRLHRGRSPIGAGFMGRMGLPARMAARRVPCFQHPVHPPCLKTWRVGFKSQHGACAMHATQQGNHAQTTPILGNHTDPVSLHMGAANSLHRALHELLIDATDYGRAVQHAESAIAAMAALFLMNGRA